MTELGRLIVPIVAVFDRVLAAELWRILESFADGPAVEGWLASRLTRVPVSIDDLITACRPGDLNTARSGLGIRLRELNAAIDALGPPFERLRNDDGIRHAFDYFVRTHRERILASLRTPFAPTYRARRSLGEYVARRDLRTLEADPRWPEDYFDLDDQVITAHVDAWLAEAGAPPLDSNLPEWPALDNLRRANRARLHYGAGETSANVWDRGVS